MRQIALGAALAVALTAALALASRAVPARAATGDPTAFNGNGMWIWYVSQSAGGASAIASQANAHNIDTVYVKSADGPHFWSQFSESLVDGLHDQGLKVCGWQYMYGESARKEAEKAAKAVNEKGADCFVMDPEIEFEGRYVQADRYIKKFRNLVGTDFPLGLATFPYADFHPAMPYSVFLRPTSTQGSTLKGAQFNVPQMYWKAIGDTPDETFARTYETNFLYERRIYPLGQTFQNPGQADIHRFRRLALSYSQDLYGQDLGVSWWSWQETTGSEWDWVGDSVTPLDSVDAVPDYPQLNVGSAGDFVIWAQEHLKAAGYAVSIDGGFGSGMGAKVAAFKQAHGLAATSTIGNSAWEALLAYVPINKAWASSGNPSTSSATASSAEGHGENPSSATLPARRYEIPPAAKR